MVCHSFPCCRLLSILHLPIQRHLVGYDANDHVASTPSLPLHLAMIPRFVVSKVSLCPRIRLNYAGRDERDGWDEWDTFSITPSPSPTDGSATACLPVHLLDDSLC